MAKKFLDESGLETLWSKVKSEDNSKLSEAKSYTDSQIKTTTGITGFNAIDGRTIKMTTAEERGLLIPMYDAPNIIITAYDANNNQLGTTTINLKYASGIRVVWWAIYLNGDTILGGFSSPISYITLSDSMTHILLLKFQA